MRKNKKAKVAIGGKWMRKGMVLHEVREVVGVKNTYGSEGFCKAVGLNTE